MLIKLFITAGVLTLISMIFTMPTLGLAAAISNTALKSQVSIYWAREHFVYREIENDTGMESKSRLNKYVVGIEGRKRWDYLFAGVKFSLPLCIEGDQEETTRFGKLYQYDHLELRWVKMDGYAGYPFRHWVNPYVGVRWSDVTQERKNFNFMSKSLTDLTASENVRSWHFLFGITGIGKISPRWIWNYRLEYFLPLKVEVTNSVIQDFNSSDSRGYTLELQGGIDYLYSDFLSFGFLLYGGLTHWNGSDWKATGRGFVKWPENETTFVGAGLMINCGF
jgi:hypothetical protein